MTPRQARVALVAFMLTASGVAYNALYLQDVGSSARRTATSIPAASSKQGKGAAAAVRAGQAQRAASGKQAKTAGASPGAETVRAIQRELNQRGYGPVPTDGIMQPVTRAAIISFEQDGQLPVTGEATDALLARLVLGAPASGHQPVASAGQVQSVHAEDTIKHVQRLLAANGYRPGPADGKFGSATIEAIRAFEKDQGLPVKGRVSADVVARLQASSAKLKSAEVQ